jgi:O-antigen ligase
MERFALDKLLQEGRPALWANTLRIISDFPLVGTGLGTFSSLYPDLYGEAGPLRLSHTHNDYLEFLSELGIIGMLFLLAIVLIMLSRILLVWSGRRYPEAKALALGGIIAIFGILIHSITDFNLHIPANVLLFTIILSLTMVMVFYRRTERKKP